MTDVVELIERLLPVYMASAGNVPILVSETISQAAQRNNPELVTRYAFALLLSGKYDLHNASPRQVAAQAVSAADYVANQVK